MDRSVSCPDKDMYKELLLVFRKYLGLVNKAIAEIKANYQTQVADATFSDFLSDKAGTIEKFEKSFYNSIEKIQTMTSALDEQKLEILDIECLSYIFDKDLRHDVRLFAMSMDMDIHDIILTDFRKIKESSSKNDKDYLYCLEIKGLVSKQVLLRQMINRKAGVNEIINKIEKSYKGENIRFILPI